MARPNSSPESEASGTGEMMSAFLPAAPSWWRSPIANTRLGTQGSVRYS